MPYASWQPSFSRSQTSRTVTSRSLRLPHHHDPIWASPFARPVAYTMPPRLSSSTLRAGLGQPISVPCGPSHFRQRRFHLAPHPRGCCRRRQPRRGRSCRYQRLLRWRDSLPLGRVRSSSSSARTGQGLKSRPRTDFPSRSSLQSGHHRRCRRSGRCRCRRQCGHANLGGSCSPCFGKQPWADCRPHSPHRLLRRRHHPLSAPNSRLHHRRHHHPLPFATFRSRV
mmetsp:Transcript_21673/g.73106  ORF Transcript_21673/g.73106 Transcript_21673/m.73106 type:complete len:225 (+) Transcript_21673:378-1052(+)